MKTLYTLMIALLTLNVVNAQLPANNTWSRALLTIGIQANALGTDTIHREITDVQADSLIKANDSNDNFVILDIRRPTEIKSGYIKNAEFINFEDPNFSSLVNDLDRDKVYLVYCQSGGRSGSAFTLMISMKFREVYNMLLGFKQWKKDSLEYVVDSTTYIPKSQMMTMSFKIYPNPSTEKLIFENNLLSKSGTFTIYNSNGQEQIKQTISERKSEINVSSLPSGVYVLRFTNDQTVETRRFVKQ